MDHLQARVSASGVRRITSAPTTVPHATINQDYANLGTVQVIYYYDLPSLSLNLTRALRSARLTQVTTILWRGCWKLCPTPCLLFPFSGLFLDTVFCAENEHTAWKEGKHNLPNLRERAQEQSAPRSLSTHETELWMMVGTFRLFRHAGKLWKK